MQCYCHVKTASKDIVHLQAELADGNCLLWFYKASRQKISNRKPFYTLSYDKKCGKR